MKDGTVEEKVEGLLLPWQAYMERYTSEKKQNSRIRTEKAQDNHSMSVLPACLVIS